MVFNKVINKPYFFQLYEKNEVLADRSDGCQFQSTVLEYEDPHQLLSAYKSGELTKFQAFWYVIGNGEQ